MFVPERNLKDLVIYYVKSEERSISSLTRALTKDGFKFHRLFLTGYLKALADTGYLREKEIPPAKVYTTSAHRDRTLYEALGAAVRAVEADEARGARLCVAALLRLFHRPVFLRELKACGYEAPGDLQAAGKEDREEARRALSALGMKIPTNEPAYVADDRRAELREALVASLLVERYGLQDLVLETKQLKLA